jgi:hypothetical protein
MRIDTHVHVSRSISRMPVLLFTGGYWSITCTLTESEETMRNDLLVELEQVIVQLPDRAFSYTYLDGLRVTLWHDNIWRGEITGINRPDQTNAATFQEIDTYLLSNYLNDQSLHQLLDAAKEQLASMSW